MHEALMELTLASYKKSASCGNDVFFPFVQVGNIITLPLAALLCDYGFDNGWGSIFYVYGIFGIVW